ncbi:MAG: RNA methyltransferase [Pseudomonadota bacterium]
MRAIAGQPDFEGEVMAYDKDLAARFRAALSDQKHISEKRMMGGQCFLKYGHMIGGADRTRDGQRHFMFRVGKDGHEAAARRPGAMPMVQGGRTMTGLLFVDADDCDETLLKSWIDLALAFVETLPPKEI